MGGLRIAVLAGRGKTGRAVVSALAEVGVDAVPIGRVAPDELPDQLVGCDAAYLIAPNMHPDEPVYAATVLDAARSAGVGRVVMHSVASPHAPAMPHHLGKARAEDLVRRWGGEWTILQPGAYLQNFPLDGSPIAVAYNPEARFGFADLADLGEVAATVLVEDGHHGATYELASVAASVSEVAAAAGANVEVTTPELWADSDGAALDERVRDWIRAMFDYYDRHGLPVGTLPMRALLGRPATTLEEAVARATTG
ncbi:MAG: NAD(P)H-binding protein [Nocardioides sp.]|nr:NAD(P)H-binding protein [Nocardioides sp.]